MGRGRWLTDGSFSAVFLRNHARQSNDASGVSAKNPVQPHRPAGGY